MTASGTGEVGDGTLPRSVKQVRDIHYSQRHSDKTSCPVDPVQQIIMMQKTERPGNQFIRAITFTEDNATMALFTDEQIDYLKTQCSAGSDFQQPIHVDVTYNLCDFYALVFTMRCAAFIADPLIVGPILLTKRQREQDFTLLWQAIQAKEPELYKEPLVFVTDGDNALINSIKSSFPNSSLYRCISHLRRNLTGKLREFGIPDLLAKIVLSDFGKQLKCYPVALNDTAAGHISGWRCKGKELKCSGPVEKFIAYYTRTVKPVVSDNLTPLVEAAGFKNEVSNNVAESANAVIKRHTGEKNRCEEVVRKLKDMIVTQDQEVKRAFQGTSRKFHLKPSLDDMADASTSGTGVNPIHWEAVCDDDHSEEKETRELVSMSFAHSAVADRLGVQTVSMLETEADKVKLMLGDDLTVAKSGDGEHLVRTGKRMISCDCATHSNLKVCEHVISVVKARGLQCFNSFIRSFKQHNQKSLADTVAHSGDKPCNRRGVRTQPRNLADTTLQALLSGGYVAIRRSSRIKKCHGCKSEFVAIDKYVIQHKCAVPYRAKSADGGKLVWVTPSKPGNHYFHLLKACVTKSEHHSDFDGDIEVCPSVGSTVLMKEDLNARALRLAK